MTRARRITAASLLLLCSAAQAAKPTSIAFISNAETSDGKPYAQYTVKCNDGRTVPLTAWDGHRKWCVGETGNTSCNKQQISAARSACLES